MQQIEEKQVLRVLEGIDCMELDIDIEPTLQFWEERHSVLQVLPQVGAHLIVDLGGLVHVEHVLGKHRRQLRDVNLG
eukprot:scaffold254142_cov27-Tisochrysis_lutea.AAC.2